jgi:hypothetical protein
VPVHASGPPTGFGPAGIRDQVPSSAGTVVTVTGAVVGVEDGEVVFAEVLGEAPQALAAITSAPTSSTRARLLRVATSSSLTSRLPL